MPTDRPKADPGPGLPSDELAPEDPVVTNGLRMLGHSRNRYTTRLMPL